MVRISIIAALDKEFLLMISTGKLLELLVVIYVSDVMQFNFKAVCVTHRKAFTDVQDRAPLRNIQNYHLKT